MRNWKGLSLGTALCLLMIWLLIPISAVSALRVNKGDPAPFQGVLLDDYDFRDLKATEAQFDVLNRDFVELQLETRNDKNWPRDTWYKETFIGGIILGIVVGLAVK